MPTRVANRRGAEPSTYDARTRRTRVADRGCPTKPSSGWKSTPSCSPPPRSSVAARRASARRPTRTSVPVCLGLPGALPVLNRQAVDLALRAGLALGCAINPRSVFARKNYFYPDLPKGYQISQYDQPLVGRGQVARDRRRPRGRRSASRAFTSRRTPASRCTTARRMPASARRSTSTGPACRSSRSSPSPTCGRPLTPSAFFEQLRATLVWIGVNDGNMEEGSLRCDANVSVRPVGESRLGTKAEVKNLNSFRYLRQALEYEIERQIDLRRTRAAASSRKRGCGIRRPAAPSRCAARKKRTTTATSRSRICRRSSVDAGAHRRARDVRCPNCPPRGASV